MHTEIYIYIQVRNNVLYIDWQADRKQTITMSVPEECFNYKIFGLEQSALRETAFENIFCSTGRRDASKSQGFNLNAPLSFYSVANLSFTGKICGTQQQQVF